MLSARNAWMLCALLPGLALLAWRDDGRVATHLLLAWAAALVFEAAALWFRRQPLAPFLAEGSALSFASLVVLCQPELSGWRLLLSLFVGLVLARQAFGGLGRNIFHPVAVALVCAQVLGVPATGIFDVDLASCWLLGGILLAALGIGRWQASAGLLLGALLGSGGMVEALFDPRWMLMACFVVTDPVTSHEDARLRFIGAAIVGAIAAWAGNAAAVLPLALLALNATVPLVESLRRKPVGVTP